MRYAHLAAIAAAREAGAILSFDPNLRFPLWPDPEQLRQTVLQFLPRSHMVKISDEELAFLTGCQDIQQALPRLFVGNIQLVVYTCGSNGAYAFTRSAQAFAPCTPVKAVDTTGAGDAFIGSFLWQMAGTAWMPPHCPSCAKRSWNSTWLSPTDTAAPVCSSTAH